MKTQLNLGDAILLFSLFIWVTIEVGPWWLGVSIFILAIILNIIGDNIRRK